MSQFAFSPTWHSKRQYEIFHSPARFVVLPGGRRSGKTTGALMLIAEEGLTREGIKILWVDTTQGNIDKYVNEILIPALPKNSFHWNGQLKILRFKTGSTVHFGSAERPQNLEGFGYQLVILNEAGIILKGGAGERLWHNTLRPMMMEEKDGIRCKVFFVGTPKGSGLFRDFAERADAGDDGWVRFNLSTYDNPLLPRAEIDSLVKDSPGKIARQEIFGEFIEDDEEEAVIPSEVALGALARDDVPDLKKDYFVFWGVDVARGGHDRSVLVRRRHRVLIGPVLQWQGLDTYQLAEKLKELYKETPDEDKPKWILIDEIGVGSGVVDTAKRQFGLPIRGVNVSRKAYNEAKFTQLRDELWWKMRKWLETASIQNEPELARELARPVVDRKTLDEKGKFKVEAKAKMESRLGAIEGRSPDLADALMLTFDAGLEQRTDRPEHSDYGRRRLRLDDYSFMGA